MNATMKIKTMPAHADDRNREDVSFNDAARSRFHDHVQLDGYAVSLGIRQNRTITISKTVNNQNIEYRVHVKAFNVRHYDPILGFVFAHERGLYEKGTTQLNPSDIFRKKIDLVAIALNFETHLEFLILTIEQYKEWVDSKPSHCDIWNTRLKCYQNLRPADTCCISGKNVRKMASSKNDPNRLLFRATVNEIRNLSHGWSYSGERLPTEISKKKKLPVCIF